MDFDMAGGPRLFRIADPFEGRLAVSERPVGWSDLEDEVAAWRASGIGAIVSMMEADEAEELGLAEQGALCALNDIDFIPCPVSDHGIPGDEAALLVAAQRALAHISAGRHVAAHCFAGIGRSPLFVACVLVLHGLPAETAWARIRTARGIRLPDTRAQFDWVAGFETRLRAPRS